MIDELPDAPDPAVDPPSVFSTKAAALVLAQKSMVPQFNAAIAAFNAALAGGAYAIPYVFDATTTDADPTAGKLRLDNATQNAATTIRLDTTSSGIGDVTSLLDRFDASTSAVKGSIRLVKQGDISKWLTFDVAARAAPSGYRNITVANTGGSSASPFTNGDGVLLFFQRNGDQGTAGSLTPVLWVRDEKANTTAGGSAAAGTYTVRTLNTTKKNTISGASVSSNQITLPIGTYRLEASAPASNVAQHQLWLYSVTDGAVHTVGTSETSFANTENRSRVGKCEFTLSAAKTFELRHWTNTGTTITGLGAASSTGQIEVYAEVFIEKVS